ncbi:transglycosylase domain-containing protein [Demequina sp. NBRC 110053]|uniref:transglycosylase domain-containing protein n=1 Tax=Demequina sp. NBRC 110053 TaxID=1570342 RepID=UPI0009FD8659|nr:transglycosylase domain-containing protein [Demequina sp. NBRC 110053]
MSDSRTTPQRRSTRVPAGRQTGQPAPGVQRTKDGKPASGLPAWSATGAAPKRTAAAKQAGKGSGSGDGGGRTSKRDDWPAWRRWLWRIGIWSLIALLVVSLVGIILLTVRYFMLEIPEPNDFAQAQSSIFYYADGETELGRLGVADREVVAYEDLPEHVGNAIVAAEDRSFWTNPGINIPGMVKALWDTVVLDNPRGGSSITQQYVERYYVGETTTSIKGKIDETLMALKIDQQQPKEEVLENYMNTIYFGRGAYGIQAAAEQYYGKDAADLTVSESAMIAGLIPAPSAWDPRVDHDKAEERWNYVLDGMVDAGFLSAEERADITEFPEPIEYQNEDVYAGPEGYLLREALLEVERVTGVSQEEIESLGYRVTTTIVPEHQDAAEAAVAEMPDDHADNLRVAAVTVDSATGAITSMYGGEDYLEIQRNAVTQDVAQAGSTFKPFALIAGLERGIGLESQYLGNNDMEFEGFDRPVRNFGGVSYGVIDLVKATQSSVNTAYVGLNEDVTPQATMETAIAAGVPEDTLGLDSNPSNVLGSASPHAIDMASAYATLAAGGIRTDPYMVASVTDAQGEVVFEHEDTSERVFAEDVMADTTYAMQQVVRFGSGSYAGESIDRPLAGKTGTSNENRSAWFVGFSPQIVGAVSLYQVGEDGSAEQITPFGGFDQITGSTIPTRVWTWMMEPILADMEVVDFPPRANVGSATSIEPSAPPSPTPSPTPEETTTEPEPEPEPTETTDPPEPEPEPEPSETTEPPDPPQPTPTPAPTITVTLP